MSGCGSAGLNMFSPQEFGTNQTYVLSEKGMALLQQVCHNGGGALRFQESLKSGQCGSDHPPGCL